MFKDDPKKDNTVLNAILIAIGTGLVTKILDLIFTKKKQKCEKCDKEEKDDAG